MIEPRALVEAATRFMLFTGKGGVGKTSVACAVAVALAERGRRVLLVSTDPASNLDEMLSTPLAETQRPVRGVTGLDALNIDPDAAAKAYRERVLAPYRALGDEAAVVQIGEELSGACTIEIAAFDAFAGLLAGDADAYDHVVFDTAPTGHTLRLLALPRAWSGFLEDHARAPSCLGPHSGLTMQLARFEAALAALTDPQSTIVVLVTRAECSALAEAARTAEELIGLDLRRQHLVINARFVPSLPNDPVAAAFAARADAALQTMPDVLRHLPRTDLPMLPVDLVGLDALRTLLADERPRAAVRPSPSGSHDVPSLSTLVDAIEAAGRGLVMVMGKGGVGKTTVAAAVAVGLARRGRDVHLSTTDPAAHLSGTLVDQVPGLRVSQIDPRAETETYIVRMMATRGKGLDAEGLRLLAEDLRSPCNEEIAVFQAFSRIVGEARNGFVVLDTAPTGHTLLLMDATGAHHRQSLREWGDHAGKVTTPLMRLQDPEWTRILLVTLAETTPVSEAAALQEDLRRAGIEPFAWVVEQTLVGSGTRDPLLAARIQGELRQIDRVRNGLAQRLAIVPWRADPPTGSVALTALLEAPACVAGS